jgi:membrane-associated phospholipid phosphatase
VPRQSATPPAKTCGLKDLGDCFKDFMHDQAGIWTSPKNLRSMDLLWLLPFGGATGVAIVTDSNALNSLKTHSTLAHRSRIFSESGSPYAIIGASALFYAIGSGTHNDPLRETGVLSAEALADTAVVVGVIKLATNRERPYTGTGEGRFWPTGSNYPAGFSMPSMHAAGTWAFARVVAGEYPDNPWLKVALYGWASAVSITRVTGQKHFPSDVLVGSLTGYLVGGYVIRHHASAYRQDPSYAFLPYSNPATGSYGLSVAVRTDALQPDALEKSFHQLTSRVAFWNHSN